jgi:hypothetical protein
MLSVWHAMACETYMETAVRKMVSSGGQVRLSKNALSCHDAPNVACFWSCEVKHVVGRFKRGLIGS